MGIPVNSLESPRFCGIRTFQRLPYETSIAGNDFAVLGIPFDTATSYKPGCRFGPAAVREASTILKSYNSVLDIDIFEHLSGIDNGDIDIIPGHIDESFSRIEQGMTAVLNAEAVPIVIGGDHSITLPQLRAVAKKHGPVALFHFDAHSDTGDSFFGKPYNHGTTFHWAIEEGVMDPEQSTQVGIRGPLYSRTSLDYARRKNFKVIPGWDLHHMGMGRGREHHARKSTAPHSGLCEFRHRFPRRGLCSWHRVLRKLGGFTSHEALKLVLGCCTGQHLVGMDLVEVLPETDHAGITSFAAAGIMHAFISCLAFNKKNIGKIKR